MRDLSFPIFKTKLSGATQSFRLEDPVERRKYFELKAGPEIEKLRQYLERNTFVGFLMGKKNAGKGTYSKLFMECVGVDRVAHISVGDTVRAVLKELKEPGKKQELVSFLRRRYRGFMPLEQAVDIIQGYETKTLLPTEAILALVEREIDKHQGKAIFIDGFPRNFDQISYSLYFRALMGYRDDPDFFVFIDLPESVLDERMKNRVICPQCQTPRSLRFLRTKEIGYDAVKNEYFLICDNASCQGFGKARLVPKEGDELGIENIRERLEVDEKIMKTLMELQGVPKVFLRNAIPQEQVGDYADPYELTQAYRYQWNESLKKVEVFEEPWVVKDDNGVPCYSLLPQAVAVSLIKQTTQALGL